MTSFQKVWITSELATVFPEVGVFQTSIRLKRSMKVDEAIIREEWKRLHEEWRGKSETELLGEPNIQAFRKLYAQLGIDPDRSPPSIQNIIRRFLLTEGPSRYPTIHPAVDAVNLAGVKWLIPLGVFDLSKIKGEIRLDFTKGGESFLPLGRKTSICLPDGVAVLRDDEKILSQFCYRDSEHQKVTESSVEFMILGCKAGGIQAEEVHQALSEALAYIRFIDERRD